MDKDTIKGMSEACVFDMCILEKEPEKQKEFRCESFEEFNNNCVELLQNSGINKIFNWRKSASCRNLIK